MILQNLSKAVREQNYYAVALEFVIVIAGVVIGFQVNAWAEGRSDRAAEQAIILQLRDDFAGLRATEEAYLARAAQQQRLSALWISALEGRPEPLGMAGLRQVVLDFYEVEDPERRAVLDSGPVHNVFTDPIGGERQPAASVIFQQLVASGDFRLVRSPRLRAALTRRELQREQSVTALDRNRTASGFPMAEVFLEPAFQAGSPDPVATLDAAMARPEFAAGLRTFVGVKTYNEQWYRYTYEETLAVLAVLEGEAPQ
jgi:hypothetical protein